MELFLILTVTWYTVVWLGYTIVYTANLRRFQSFAITDYVVKNYVVLCMHLFFLSFFLATPRACGILFP